MITPWIDIIEGWIGDNDCSLSMVDSMTSQGWLKKTNFKEDGEDPINAMVRIDVTWGHACQFLENEIKDYH